MNNSSNLNFKKTQLKKAFSLIELSVVVLIIGILIAGITQSSRLVRAMKLNTARSLTRSSDVASIRNLTAWFDATAEGVLSSSCNTNSVSTDLSSTTRAFNTNTSTGNPSVTTPSSAYIMPEHRQVVRLWKDYNPQDTDADKVILEYAHSTNANVNTAGNCTTQDYSVSGTIGVNRGPMYHNSGLAGLPSIYFDGGANSWFSTINPVTMPLVAGKKDFSFFAVYRTDPDYAGGNHRNILQFSATGQTSDEAKYPALVPSNNSSGCNTYPMLSWWNNQDNCAYKIYPNNSKYASKPSTEYAFGVAIDSTNATTISATNTKLYFNSVVPADNITVGGSVGLVDTINSQLNIGGGYNNNNQYAYKGFISEVLVFDRKITNEEASSVMAYLIKKYNIKAL